MKTIHIEDQQEKLKQGLIKAANIITSSMGGGGSTVIIESKHKTIITKDGVTIAKNINLPDPIENIGAKLLISAAQKTVEQTGDSTTLTSLLLKEMVINTTQDTLSELKQECQRLKHELIRQSKEVSNTDQLKQIAQTSSNSEKIGDLFKEIHDKTSLNTQIELELSEYPNTYYQINSGYQINRGYIHPAFINNKLTKEVTYENAYVHIVQKQLHYVTKELEQLLTDCITNDQPLIILANKFSDAVKSFLYNQKISRGAKVVAINLAGFDIQTQKKNAKDLESYTDENYVDRVVVTSHYTTFYNKNKPNLDTRLIQLQEHAKSAQEPQDRLDYQKRYNQLTNNIATIFVGGNTEEQRQEEYDRIEDAIGSVKSSTESGYVYGAGKFLYDHSTSSVFQSAYNKILENANIVSTPTKKGEGYNVKTKQIVNLYEEGIIDSTKSIIAAIDNALSNTELVLNTKYTLYNEL
jgi:chaperonin GroEL